MSQQYEANGLKKKNKNFEDKIFLNSSTKLGGKPTGDNSNNQYLKTGHVFTVTSRLTHTQSRQN